MTVLHYISDPDAGSLSHLFLKEMQKGGDDSLVAHVMSACPEDSLAEGGNTTVHAVTPGKWLTVAGHRQFRAVVGEVKPDVIHIHSFWDTSAWLVSRWAKKERIPVVVSVYRQLMDWNYLHRYAQSKLPRYVAMQRAMLKDAFAIHAVSEQEAERIRQVAWIPAWKASKPLNEKIAVVRFAANTGDGPDYRRLAAEMQRLYRKVVDSNPFLLMTAEDRLTENGLLALGASMAADVPAERIYLDMGDLKDRAERLTPEEWRRMQLHAADQGVLQPVAKAYASLRPEGELLDVDAVDRFGKRAPLQFLETMRTKDKVARMKQLAGDYARYETERKLCVMFVNMRRLVRHRQASRRNITDLYLVLRYEEYNDYVLENMLDEIGMLKFARRMLYVLKRSMNLEEGYMPFGMACDRKAKNIMRTLFKSNIQ